MIERSELFSTSIEAGLRSLGILESIFPSTLDIGRLVALDHIVVHSKDFDVEAPESLHPPSPYRRAEPVVRRDLVRLGIDLMVARNLVHRIPTPEGFTYCLKNDRPHPGFVVLDSPLLSYRGEENESDPTQDLKSTTVDQAFYRWLANDLSHGQVIVIENRDPPLDVRAQIHLDEFLPNADRKGFIPTIIEHLQ